MSNEKKIPDNIEDMHDEYILYRQICDHINKLSKISYADLRLSLLNHATIEDWKKMMSS